MNRTNKFSVLNKPNSSKSRIDPKDTTAPNRIRTLLKQPKFRRPSAPAAISETNAPVKSALPKPKKRSESEIIKKNPSLVTSDDLPWQEYDMTKAGFSVNYPTMIQELNTAERSISTRNSTRFSDTFESNKVSSLLDLIYSRIRTQVDIQRATLAYLKLDHPDYAVVDDLYQKHTEIEQAIEDIYFASKSAYPTSHEIDSPYSPTSTQMNSKTTSMTSLMDYQRMSNIYSDQIKLKEQYQNEQIKSQALEKELHETRVEKQQLKDAWELQETKLKSQMTELEEKNFKLEEKMNKMFACEIDELIKELETKNEEKKIVNNLQSKLDKTYKFYAKREADLLFKLSDFEREMQKTVKEYHRLTRNVTDFNSERQRLECAISRLRQEKNDFEIQLLDRKVCDLDYGRPQADDLRREFRELMWCVEQKHNLDIMREIEEKKLLERELRDVKSQVEVKRWESVNAAVQTYFDPQLIV